MRPFIAFISFELPVFMKYIIIFLFCFPLVTLAQDVPAAVPECKIKKELNKFTQEPKLTTGFITYNMGINKVLLSVDADSKEIDFFFALSPGKDGKCFDDQSTAVITLEGEKAKITYRNTGSMNCEGLFHFTFRNVVNTPTQLKKLSTKRITSIKFTGSDKKSYDINFTGFEQQEIMDMVTCMILQSKTLIK